MAQQKGEACVSALVILAAAVERRTRRPLTGRRVLWPSQSYWC